MGYEELMVGHVLPLVICKRVAAGEYELVRVAGTCFTFGQGTVVTAHHCVAGGLGPDEAYCVGLREQGWDAEGGTYSEVYAVEDLSQVADFDLALGRIGIKVDPRLTLASDPLRWGEDVVSCGYPLPLTTGNAKARNLKISTNARLLRGYVTRLFMWEDPAYPPLRAVELDMPVPPGLSGGPLFRSDPFEVVGVVISEPVVPSGRAVDEVIYPAAEFYRFGAAHQLATLRDAAAPATGDLPLAEHLKRQARP